jgi:predicted ATPase
LTNFPLQRTSFIGYQVELAQIAARLNDPECRLLTLIGPGGVGKSRLAIQAAQLNAGSFADGAIWVPLAGLPSDEWTLEAVACAVDSRFAESSRERNPGCRDWLQILQERAVLLILDHFEHLLPSVELVQQVLKTAPHLKVLVTSRQALKLPQEWVLEISGLAFPSQDVVPEAHTFDAVRLFAQCAARVQPKFTLSAQNLPAVARVCRLVQGNPLALELAAAWLSSYTPSQAAAQIAMELNALAAPYAEFTERQRATLAVFNRSWARLSVAEKTILQRASVFRGGFDRHGAQAVLDRQGIREIGEQSGESGRSPAEAPINEPFDTLLGALVEKSLLLEVDPARFDLQPLVGEYAASRLDADSADRRRTEHRHAEYYVTCLQQLEKKSAGDPMALANDLYQEIDNLRQAWEWAVANCDRLIMERGAAGLAKFYVLQDMPQEGVAAFQKATAALDPQAELENPGEENQGLLANLLEQLGYFQRQLENFE